jgi:hypothetical protein
MSALFGAQINQVMLLLGIGLFIFAIINRLRRGWGQARRPSRLGGSWRDGRESALPATREGIGSARLRSATASRDHESWEVEMHAVARQLKAEIDAKMRALEQLIQMADRAREGLEASIERTELLGLGEHGLAAASPRTPDSSFAEVARRRRNVHAMRETVSGGQARLSGDDPRFERVYALADAGFSAPKIASQIGSQVGEVELILSLRDPTQVDAA